MVFNRVSANHASSNWALNDTLMADGSEASTKRVSVGLTVSRKTAKYLAVRRKNERILTVSRYKMLTVKKSNHKSEVVEIFC